MWTLYLHVCLHAGSFMPLMFCINSRRFVSVRKFNYSQAQIQFTWSVLFVYLRYDFRVMSIDWNSSGLLYTNSFPTCVSHNALRDFLGAFTGNKVCFVRPSTASFTDSINYLWRSALLFFLFHCTYQRHAMPPIYDFSFIVLHERVCASIMMMNFWLWTVTAAQTNWNECEVTHSDERVNSLFQH